MSRRKSRSTKDERSQQSGWSLRSLADRLASQRRFCALLEALAPGNPVCVEGLWGSAISLFAAALAARTKRPIAAVLAHVSDLDPFAQDLQTFAGITADHFPAWDATKADRSHDETLPQRLRILTRLLQGDYPPCLLVPVHALVQPVPSREQLLRSQLVLAVGQRLDMEHLLTWLAEGGFRRVDTVEMAGEYAVRGGIVDLFPPNCSEPVRVEFFDDQIESLRYFDPETQRRTGMAKQIQVASVAAHLHPDHWKGHLADYWPSDAIWLLVEPVDLKRQAQAFLDRLPSLKGFYLYDGVIERLNRFWPTVTFSSLAAPGAAMTFRWPARSMQRFSGQVGRLRDELEQAIATATVGIVACHNDAERKRLQEILRDSPLLKQGRLVLDIGTVRSGFQLRLEGLGDVAVLSDHELLLRRSLRRPAPRRRYETRVIESFLDLKEGDYVVHVAHGIARFRGLEVCERHGTVEEHLVLEFAGGTRVLVPASRIQLVQKYVGGRGQAPPLSTYGGTAWQKRKAQVAQAVRDLAAELLRLQALRLSRPGYAFKEETEWQAEFEASFPFQETPDQLRVMEEIKQDMARPRPMDRLLCGDVGFGKTELAMRAAFRAVDHGKQVAVLVPTTVLAEQHYRTFTERFAAFPFEIEVLSRFKTKAEQRDILERLKQGTIDIIIGTHRLLQRDVEFHDLGLVIIDEEQRFGVAHKERLKSIRASVDVLTLTATPIPRTLHMALLGIRDISILETPPLDRLAVETHICRWDDELIREAILRELNRDGQVLFVHNRVHDIHIVAQRIQQLVPEAIVRYAHGQMRPQELERTMLDFFERRFDVLVATTIIENGLDIPTANTIFINDADRFGLADLHQLRGRVGRYKHRAYAYLLVDPSRSMTQEARERLKAIEEFSELGAGFKLAMRDLEIRGAGNILGPEQSGHIAAVGYELYCQLLEQAVRELRNEPAPAWLNVTIELPWKTLLPPDYVPDQRQRIELYRRLERLRKLEEVDDFEAELQDRFGRLPRPARNLLLAQRLRILAQPWALQRISLRDEFLVLSFANVLGARAMKERLGENFRLADDVTGYWPTETKQLQKILPFLDRVLRDPPKELQQAA